jgi:hypothetical protein
MAKMRGLPPRSFEVFLLSSSLQVDLSFWAAVRFAASAASFRLLFGESNEPRPPRSLVPGVLIGMGWLYALHARSSIARGRALQALHMINALRDQVGRARLLAPRAATHEGRGVDDVGALLDEAQQIDPDREQRLRETVWGLVHTLPEHHG